MPSRRRNWATWTHFQGRSGRRIQSGERTKSKSISRTAAAAVTPFLVYSALIVLITPCVQSKYFEDSTSEELFPSGRRHVIGSSNWTEIGISPPVLNLATKATIHVNATCGEEGPETFCKLVEHAYRRHNGPLSRSSQCQVCDAHSSDKGKRHPVHYTIDGSNRWWQSPTLQNGRQYEWVTITIDLKQIYQVAYIIIKAAISPRPANWILERSINGVFYQPWQYYAMSDEECWNKYGIRAKQGKPSYDDDEEVICTSYYSQITPFEGGEIHTSLVNGRPGADGPSSALTQFTMARYVRLRLQKIRTLHGDLINVGGPGEGFVDKSVLRRYFYSIKDISIGGHCVCFGHANECVMDAETQSEKCMCQHNTCGDRCDMCCPLFNQYPWGAGNSTASARCEPCQCHGHAESCIYDKFINDQKLSMNIHGEMDGGGVCLECKHHTTGINCEKCIEKYYRPKGVPPNHPNPCVKCDCDPNGSIEGKCVGNEDEGRLAGKEPGNCYCKEGYEGKRCDKCSMGWKGFPKCETCPCHLPGIVNMDCEGDCVCKGNVEGKYCTQCKKGHFNLIKANDEGCTQCFCHGVSTQCTSSNFPILKIIDEPNWLVTDLHGTKIVQAVQAGQYYDNHTSSGIYQIANEEFASFSEYYWTTLSDEKRFSGNHIHSYGLNVTFHVSWVQARGDTSGKPIQDYDLIIQGKNSMLGFNRGTHDGDNATISAVLTEQNCMVLPDVDNHIVQMTPVPSQGTPCTRYDVMETLSDIKKLLFRAKFHTDQIEGQIHFAYMEKANVEAGDALEGQVKAVSVEVCECPKGYAGTSCEKCDYGYRRLSSSWLNVCVKCDCNGHSSSCDLEGNCLECDHNTTGPSCQFCKEGFYGDPTKSESHNACKPCECPLGLPTNNFSPTCVVSGNSYECTACPKGYEGEFCERCAKGYYGNPTQPGDTCKPCQCSVMGEDDDPSKDICDHLTGECLVCPRNTVGWNCDECLVGHYGNPLNASCIPCECSEIGSLLVTSCHVDTGQCHCKENFAGRKCNLCKEGCGNIMEGCPPCGCNRVGSVGDTCDVVTGQCKCKEGVGGRFCNKCLDNHFGFSLKGCVHCDCDPKGSDSDLCDLNTGQCHCLPHVTGRRCDECEDGWWNLRSGKGCEKCNCDPMGSLTQSCDQETGQCMCKSGISGKKCDGCEDGHFGMGNGGCKICDPCDKPGHICDPATGKCVCPPNTVGDFCEKCEISYWGFVEGKGCSPCNCSQQGSIQPQCNPDTGKCVCQPGYQGNKCNECAFGYYNYPSCTPCNCDPAGTLESECRSNGTCSCSSTGNCLCKENVMGKTCDRCKPGHYGLEAANPEGCMQCFCFQRTDKCSQGYFKWQRFAMPISHDRLGSVIRNDDQLRLMNNLMTIPDTARDIIIGKDISFSMPLYWQLPQIFLGDKVLSYNGYLRFHTHSIAGVPVFPNHVLSTYPVIQMQGNHRLILEHFSEKPYKSGFYEVKLHEDEWRLKHGPHSGHVTKEVMMVALQNLQHVLIRATYSPEVFNASIFNVSLDIAVPSPNGDKTMAHGIEVCECPPEYNSTSCQNPRIGYYRWYKRDYITSTVIIDLVGEAKQCECNGRASSCDTETGSCQNCLENTSGSRCDICAEGYYGNPTYSRCHPCPCPAQWNNHARSCFRVSISHRPFPLIPQPPQSFGQFHCQCKQGFTGPHCDRCDYGYYGRPWERGGHCTPCKCNVYGSVSDECHEITGQCNCRPGVTGRDCSKCRDRHIIIGKECTSCNDQCSGTLLNDLDVIAMRLSGLKVDPEQVLVFKRLVNIDMESKKALAKVSTAIGISLFLDDLPRHENLASMMDFRVMEMSKLCQKVLRDAFVIVEKGKLLHSEITSVNSEMAGVIKFFKDYADGKIQLNLNSDWAQKEAGDIISSLEQTGMDLTEITTRAEEELNEINRLYDLMLVKIFNSSGNAGDVFGIMKDARDKLEDFSKLLKHSEKVTEEATRTLILAKEHLETLKVNVEAIDNLIDTMDMVSAMTETTIGEGGYLKTELEQVFFQIEDMLRDFRNTTKELEIRDNMLFDTVPLYRVLYAQPAFDHELELIMRAKYIESLFGESKLNGSDSIGAVTAFDRILKGFMEAKERAENATKIASRSASRINEILNEHDRGTILEVSSELVDSGLRVSGIIENGLRGNLSKCSKDIDGLSWNMKVANETLKNINKKLDGYQEQDMKLGELSERIDEIKDTVDEISMSVMETETKVNNEIKARLDAIRGGAPFDAVDAAIEVNRAQAGISQVERDMRRQEQRQNLLQGKRESLEDKMKYLKALIKQSKHKANTVGVSVGPDETGTCFRVYKWPSIDSATSVVFNFAPTRREDSLLFYWPSSLNEDFIAIEIINLHVKASWDLGSGTRSLIHPMKLKNLSLDSDDPDYWYSISFERIGSSATLEVKQVQTDPSAPVVSARSVPVKYANSDEEATLLNLSPSDYLHIGGMSRETRPNLVENGLSGCIHNLEVNHQPLGLWNFARTEGCAPCVECPQVSLETLPSGGKYEYYFDGRGYSVISRIQSQAFNSRVFDVSLEFRTFSENGLLFLTVNDTIGQMISVELKAGKVIMMIRHKWDDSKDLLRVETDDKYNTGEWTVVRALWMYQRNAQTQAARLILGGKKDFTKEKRSNSGQLTLKLFDAIYQIGGVSPTFDPTKWDDVLGIVPYVGCMKNILVDGLGYDPMAGHYFGVESPCSGKSVYLTSFEGNGYAEFGSQPIGKNFKLGFSFKTVEPTGLMILSTFAKSLDSPDEHYYAVFLDNGKIQVQIGIPQGPFDLTSNGTRYDDGRFHSLRFFKKNRRLFLYVDDDELMEIRLPRQVTAMVNAPDGRGLFIGGTTSDIQMKFGETPLNVRTGFKGCIQNFYFGNELLNFNYPVSYQNQNLGQCPKHHDPDPLTLYHGYLYPNTMDSVRHESVVRMTDPECAFHGNPVIEQEEPFKAWHFGDESNSYATLSLLGSKMIKQSFNITFHFRTLYPNGMFFQGLKKRGNGGYCLMSFLKDGQVIVKLHGNRPQDLVSSVSGLNDGKWHQIFIVKAEDKLYLHVDSKNATSTQVPKIKAIGRMHIGGVPSDGHDCLENSIHKPEYFKGCMKNFIINSHVYNLDSNSAQLNNVSPCFKTVEPGTFFRTGSYVVYSHNFTLGTMMEVQLDFRSDSRNGLLLTLVPNKFSKYPRFTIFLKDGKVIARETMGPDDYYEAVADFQPDKGLVCDGHWHNVRANYEKGSITLRVDNRTPIFALAEPETPLSKIGGFPSASDVGTIYIGGIDDGASRSNNKLQFHGCIRNIVLNRQIRDWTDMALNHNVYLNSCPL